MFRILPVKILLLLNLCFAMHIGAENKQVVTEMQLTNNDSIFKFNYLYNNQALPVVETKTLKIGTNWENISQTEWFRTSDLPARQVERLWANNKWNDNYSIRYENIYSKIVETHSAFSNSTEKDIRKIETYFANNLKTKQIEYIRINESWEKKLETRFFYSLNNSTDSTIIYFYNNNELKNSYKTSYNYYPNASLKSIVMQTKSDLDIVYNNVSKSVYTHKANFISSLRNYSWDSKTLSWDNATKLEYLYDEAGNVSEEISWLWNSMFWIQVIRYTYQYDAESQLFKKLVSKPLFREWRNTNSVNYLREQDSRNINIESVYGFWGGKAGEKLNTHISFPFNNETIIRKAETIQLKYIPFVESSVNNAANNPSFIKVYPNPSNGIFYISNLNTTNANWTLSSLNGTILRNSNLNFSSSIIDITNLPNGVYLLNIRSASENGTYKIVKY